MVMWIGMDGCVKKAFIKTIRNIKELEGRLSFLFAHHAVFVRQQVPSQVYMSPGSHKTLDMSFYKTYYRLAKIPVYLLSHPLT